MKNGSRETFYKQLEFRREDKLSENYSECMKLFVNFFFKFDLNLSPTISGIDCFACFLQIDKQFYKELKKISYTHSFYP